MGGVMTEYVQYYYDHPYARTNPTLEISSVEETEQAIESDSDMARMLE